MGRRATGVLRWLASPLAVVLALPALIPAAVLFAAHTEAGRELIASTVYRLSGGQVALRGLTGVLPHAPRVARLELRDAGGTWLSAEDVALDLDLPALFRREIAVDSLCARSLTLRRLPEPSEESSGASSAGIQPPWPMRIGDLRVAALDLDAVAAGVPVLAVQAAASSHGAGESWQIGAARIDAPGASLALRGTVSLDALALDGTLDLPDLGALLPGAAGPLRVQAAVTGAPSRPELRARLEGAGLTLPGAVQVAGIEADARIADLLGGAAAVEASARLTGLAAGGVAGEVALQAQGALAALGLTAEADLRAGGEPVRVGLNGRLDAVGRALTLERLAAAARGETLRLAAPAALDLSDGVAVERLRLALRQGAIEVGGRLAPSLALDATVADLPADLLRLAVPGPGLAGTLGGQARIEGAAGNLAGSVRVRGDGLGLTEGPGRGLPPASITVTAELRSNGADIDARATAGKGTAVGLTGRVGDALDLRAEGRLDLALLDPLLAGSGRGVRGEAALDARVTGTPGAPRVDGGVRLAKGAYWDRSIGLALTEVQGRLALAGDTLRVEKLGARAGPGTLEAEGTIGLLAAGVPVDLRIGARDARPLQRDELDLQASGDLRLTGAAAERLLLAGALRLDGVEFRLPERLPAAIPTLDVRETGQRRAPPPGARGAGPGGLELDLDLALAAPRKVVVQGRGVYAELGGEVHLQGPADAPTATGGFELIHGQLTLVGQPLRFSRGRIGFDGGPALAPTLDLEARTTAAGATAILAVAGTASAPRVELRGEPEMPQDEVLARLLFGVPGGRLSPWQATRLGLAAAALAGERVPGAGALTRAGRALGLGRLGLLADEQGDVAVEGGRDLSDRTYLGARQSSRSGEPQGVLRFEATPRLRFETDVGPVGGTRAGVAFEHEF